MLRSAVSNSWNIIVDHSSSGTVMNVSLRRIGSSSVLSWLELELTLLTLEWLESIIVFTNPITLQLLSKYFPFFVIHAVWYRQKLKTTLPSFVNDLKLSVNVYATEFKMQRKVRVPVLLCVRFMSWIKWMRNGEVVYTYVFCHRNYWANVD